jgi:4-diphosphocytidyl-2-C-methyl-D-erythritol kinase
MIAFPNAKINLGLKVVNKRMDGFHTIQTVFYPVGLCDILEVVVANDGIFSFQSTGLPIPGDPNDNLCVKAYHLIAAEMTIPPLKIHLHKVIPMGAGIGGGSSDGAFMIKLLNDLFSLGFSEETMTRCATRLGSDCAFFIRNQAAYAEGKGDQLSTVDLDLSGFKIAIVVPDVHVNTREAYQWLDSHETEQFPTGHDHTLHTKFPFPVNLWKGELVNDFESVVFSRYPEIREIKELLCRKGAIYASMTGSGAAVYGLFKENLKDLSGFGNNFFWIG